MSHRDKECRTGSKTYAQELVAAIDGLLSDVDWKDLRFRKDCHWAARGLVTAALVWACSSKTALKDRFNQALRIAKRLGRRFAPAKTSYQAFIKLLVCWTPELRERLVSAFQFLMKRRFPELFLLAGYLVLAADGSKVKLARTRSNEKRYSPNTRGQKGKKRRKANRARRRARSRQAQLQQAKDKKADSPQMALTLLYHVMLRLPWDWRLGPSDVSEREHLREMIAHLPPDALVVADCGFFGYDFWSELLASGRQFVIRVGGNVRLLKKLGVVSESHGTIYLWPDKMAKRKQTPLVLRLVMVHDGRQPWYLVTSVRNPKRLSDRQVADIYRKRWRIELFFRHFKQTFGRTKLRSPRRSTPNAKPSGHSWDCGPCCCTLRSNTSRRTAACTALAWLACSGHSARRLTSTSAARKRENPSPNNSSRPSSILTADETGLAATTLARNMRARQNHHASPAPHVRSANSLATLCHNEP
jgi:hypothetical protein